MHILKKPLKDLTPEDYAAIEKPLGKRSPYPSMGLGYAVGANGQKKLVRYLGPLVKPLIVPSERSMDEIEGVLNRNMVTPEMLPQFFDLVAAVHPSNPRRVSHGKGGAGGGKTFSAELVGRVCYEDGAVKVNCTHMNLKELFYITVLDFNSDKRFYDALDRKIEKYNKAAGNRELQNSILNPVSVEILRNCLGKAFSEENEKISVDWEGVKYAHCDKEGYPLETKESTDIAIKGLTQVSIKEGFDNLGGNTLGMASERGPAWYAYKKGGFLILDEINRAKENTFGILHEWLQFLNNEIQECVIPNPIPEKGNAGDMAMHMCRSEMGCGHYVRMTSNEESDSIETSVLPEAFSSRVPADVVPQRIEMGWQHRWGQALTGLPFSTLYHMQRAVWDKDPDEFGREIIRRRTLAETKEIPEIHMERLSRWQDVLQGITLISKFMYGADKMIDPESDWHKSGTLAHLLDNIDDLYKKESAFDYRKILFFSSKAEQQKPVVRPPQSEDDVEIIPLLSEKDMPDTREEIQAKIGTHISYALLDWVVSNTYERGKIELGNQLMRLAADCGLIEPSLTEGMKSDRKTVAQYLDSNPFDSAEPGIRTKYIRDRLCDSLREYYPDITADNDDVMPVSVVQRGLDEIAEDDPALIVFNNNSDQCHQTPFQKAGDIDMVPVAGNDNQSPAKPSAKKLLSQKALLATLATPGLRQHNLTRLWNTALSDSGVVNPGQDGMVDESLAMAENRSESGIAVTTVMVRSDHDNKGQAKEQSLQLVWNKALDRVLVAGQGQISKSLKRSFDEARLVYVDLTAERAEKEIQSGFDFVLSSQMKTLSYQVKEAFLMRNRLDKAEDESEIGNAAALLLRKDLKCYLPHYITEQAVKPKAA